MLDYLHDGILNGSASASLEDGSDSSGPEFRCCGAGVRAVQLTGRQPGVHDADPGGGRGGLFLSAITSGGSQAMLFKINTLGEEAFLDTVRELADDVL